MNMFIFGTGYSGRAIAEAALARGIAVCGTTRSAEKAAALADAGIEAFIFDGTVVSPAIQDALARTTHLVASAAPDPSDPVLASAWDTITGHMPSLRWIGYLSTVGVYGDHGGAWVDEDAACHPDSRRSRLRIDAEREWLRLGDLTGIPVAVLRLSGIYGPGRNGFVNLANGTARRIVKPGQVFNRIHVSDIAGATLRLAEQAAGGIFNVTDDEPAPAQDVVAFAAALMGVEPPPEIAFEDADLTPMARSFYSGNKRVSNERLKQAGYSLLYPDYQSALTALWEGGTWHGQSEGLDARSKIRL